MNKTVLRDVLKAQAFYDAGDWARAEPLITRLLKHGLADPMTYDALGACAQFQGKIPLALSCYRKALAIDPDYAPASDGIIMILDAQPGTTAAQAQRAREQWWVRHGASRYASRQPHGNTRDAERPLRVGYVSGDFNFHSASAVFHRIACRHSDAVQPIFYSSLPAHAGDAVTNTYRRMPGWRDVCGASDVYVADLVRRDAIDILVDLSGYTGRNRLRTFCYKPAPIQISAWGYATGVGWPAMDGLVSDPVVIPPVCRSEHVERIIDLPCVITYEGPAGMPDPNPLPCLTQAPTFGVFQRSLKITAECLAVWVELLQRLPESRLVIKGSYPPAFVAWMGTHLAPVLERVLIYGEGTTRDAHLRAYQAIDLCLDTWPQTGGVTTCEALWMGVPAVTLLGPRVIQRTTASILTNLDLPAFIAETREDYISTAVAWVTTRKAALAALRVGMRDRFIASPVCAGYVEAVEAQYRTLWRAWCATPLTVAAARYRLEQAS